MDFVLDYKRTDEELILIPHGELDVYTTPNFREQAMSLYDENQKNILIDCSELAYLDSTGLGAFISLLKHVKENKHQICISHLNNSIRKLFTITKLDELFVIRGE